MLLSKQYPLSGLLSPALQMNPNPLPGMVDPLGGRGAPEAHPIPKMPSPCLWLPAPFQDIPGSCTGLAWVAASRAQESTLSISSGAQEVCLTSCYLSCPKEDLVFLVLAESMND